MKPQFFIGNNVYAMIKAFTKNNKTQGVLTVVPNTVRPDKICSGRFMLAKTNIAIDSEKITMDLCLFGNKNATHMTQCNNCDYHWYGCEQCCQERKKGVGEMCAVCRRV